MVNLNDYLSQYLRHRIILLLNIKNINIDYKFYDILKTQYIEILIAKLKEFNFFKSLTNIRLNELKSLNLWFDYELYAKNELKEASCMIDKTIVRNKINTICSLCKKKRVEIKSCHDTINSFHKPYYNKWCHVIENINNITTYDLFLYTVTSDGTNSQGPYNYQLTSLSNEEFCNNIILNINILPESTDKFKYYLDQNTAYIYTDNIEPSYVQYLKVSRNNDIDRYILLDYIRCPIHCCNNTIQTPVIGLDNSSVITNYYYYGNSIQQKVTGVDPSNNNKLIKVDLSTIIDDYEIMFNTIDITINSNIKLVIEGLKLVIKYIIRTLCNIINDTVNEKLKKYNDIVPNYQPDIYDPSYSFDNIGEIDFNHALL